MSRTPSRDEALFAEALVQPAEQREVFLAQACDTDAGLLARVWSLLAAHDGAKAFMKQGTKWVMIADHGGEFPPKP